MSLGLGSNLTKSGIVTPGIVTDNLVLKHKYDAGGVVPVSDGAAYFDGNDDYITVGDQSSLDFGTGDFSVSFWVKLITDATVSLLGKQDNSSGWYIYYESGTNVAFYHRKDNKYTNGSTDLLNNQWNHIVFTRDGAVGKIYFNGVNDTASTNDISADLDSAGDNFEIARRNLGATDDRYANCNMCNIGVWNAVLTEAQVKSIMNKNYAGLTDSDKDAGTTGSSNLVSWWNLDSSYKILSNLYVTDSHGSNDGTLT